AIENGEQLLATLKPGYRAGTFNLINGNGADMVRADCKVVWASRVIWIKPV
ncbi:MAG: helix-turn-helix transcriptional regulator, partial [Caulobacteraceae bacterium]|nr:helix-turn-helix transcriptional regulator [Caulobacteraceae bacterium]